MSTSLDYLEDTDDDAQLLFVNLLSFQLSWKRFGYCFRGLEMNTCSFQEQIEHFMNSSLSTFKM